MDYKEYNDKNIKILKDYLGITGDIPEYKTGKSYAKAAMQKHNAEMEQMRQHFKQIFKVIRKMFLESAKKV